LYYFTIVHHQSSKFNYWWFSFAALGSPANPLQFHHQLWWKLLKIERVWKLFRNSLIYLINCSLLFFSSSILQFQWLVIFLGCIGFPQSIFNKLFLNLNGNHWKLNEFENYFPLFILFYCLEKGGKIETILLSLLDESNCRRKRFWGWIRILSWTKGSQISSSCSSRCHGGKPLIPFLLRD